MPGPDEGASVSDPLITGQEQEEEAHAGRNGIAPQEDTQPSSDLKNAGKVVWLLTFSAGISGLLFGYDTGVVSSTLVSIGSDLDHRPLNTTDKSLITAITSLFALVFAPITGYLADKYGRRSVIVGANLFFILGAIVQASAKSVSLMVVGRAMIGAAIGWASCATPLYITELSPAEMRGRLVTIQSLFITGGQVVAYVIGWLLSRRPAGWRWMVGLGALPAIVQLFLLALMFETPRWLMTVGRVERARAVLLKVYGGLNEFKRQAVVDTVLASIADEIAEEFKGRSTSPDDIDLGASRTTFLDTARQLLFIPGNRRALTIACMLHCLQQLCGFNSLMYFSATIFASVGFTSPIGTSLSIALTNFLLTIVAFNYIDTIGRRKILLRSIPFMIIGLLACSLAFQFINIARSGVSPAADQGTYETKERAWPVILLISMILYVAAYAIGLGCVPWQQSELFSLRVRSLGSGLATASNWSSNFIIGSTFLPMMEFLGPSSTFFLYAFVCFAGWMCIWYIYPETAGLQLEGIGDLLKNGWGVQQSVENFQNRSKKIPDLMNDGS